MVVALECSPYDSQKPPLPTRVTELISHCHEKGLPLLLRCDANSHHKVWGSTGKNARAEALLQNLTPTELMILKKKNDYTPPFMQCVGKEGFPVYNFQKIDFVISTGKKS